MYMYRSWSRSSSERLTLCTWKDAQAVTILSAHPSVTAVTDEPKNVHRIEKDKKSGAYTVIVPQPSLVQLFSANLRGSDTRSRLLCYRNVVSERLVWCRKRVANYNFISPLFV